MPELSTKPYLLRAIHEWCSDSGLTPYIAVSVDERTKVPAEFVQNGEIVLNISLTATHDLLIDSDWIEFQARFNGRVRELLIPVGNVTAIYARENGHGMAFEVERPAPGAAPRRSGEAPARGLRAVPNDGETEAAEDALSDGDELGAARRQQARSGRRRHDGPRLRAVPASRAGDDAAAAPDSNAGEAAGPDRSADGFLSDESAGEQRFDDKPVGSATAPAADASRGSGAAPSPDAEAGSDRTSGADSPLGSAPAGDVSAPKPAEARARDGDGAEPAEASGPDMADPKPPKAGARDVVGPASADDPALADGAPAPRPGSRRRGGSRVRSRKSEADEAVPTASESVQPPADGSDADKGGGWPPAEAGLAPASADDVSSNDRPDGDDSPPGRSRKGRPTLTRIK